MLIMRSRDEIGWVFADGELRDRVCWSGCETLLGRTTAMPQGRALMPYLGVLSAQYALARVEEKMREPPQADLCIGKPQRVADACG